MKENIRCLLTLVVCFGTIALYAGDDPCAATNLSTSNSDFLYFDNSGNSDSGVEAPVIGGYIDSDIWFSFTMPNGEITLLIQADGMVDPAIAVYSGDCNNPQLIYNVLDNNCDGSVNPELLISELTSGETYYIRIWAQDGSGDGTFGLFLGPDVPSLLDFEAYDDASIQGDCIELTPEQNGQQGCAWYQLQIDFSQPFTHEMTANFGDQDASGADGICLVYQSNGPDFCGAVGGGIGALGMPNSAIFEFDTWQNGIYSDPPQDHVAFNVNGNMSHISSINGPVALTPNIEDGNDHTILFDWNPAGNLYELYFDGNLVFSGSYDIINNCFGGNNMAYWGYTSSTGAANNNHIICPLILEYTPALVSYEEITLCAGDSYNGWTESGFYITEESGANGCTHQVHTKLTIGEESDPTFLEKYICEGEVFEVEGDFFMDEGFYTIDTQTDLGCDSTIFLDLYVIIPTIDILGGLDFTCDTDSIILSIDIDVNYPIVDVDFFWDTPNGTSQSNIFIATSPGKYSVNTLINYQDVLCIVYSEIELFIDTIPPSLSDISDLTILCDTPAEDWILVSPEEDEGLDLTWYLNNAIVGLGDTLNINEEGSYTLVARDTISGCIDTISALVIIDENIPTIELTNDTISLNCQILEYTITPLITYQVPGIIQWEYNSSAISNDTTITVEEPGTYYLSIIDINGCEALDSVTITIDTLAPSVELNDIIIPCDQIDTLLNAITSTANTIATWEGPQVLNNDLTPIINTSGIYSVTITDTTNQCSTSGSMAVDVLGPSPELSITGDDSLNCIINTIELIATVDQNNASINWYNSVGTYLSNGLALSVINEGTYIVEAISSSGCRSIDSIEIIEDLLYPIITLESDTIDCDNALATIDASIVNGTIDSWETPDNNNPTTSNITTETPGIYTLNAINTATGCTTSESINVLDLSNPPIYTFNANTITCIEPSVTLNLNISSTYESVLWTFPDASTSSEISPQISEDGVYILHVEVEGSCDLDTLIEIGIDTISPSYDVDFGYIDCVDSTTYIDLINESNIESITVTSPSNIVYNELENLINESGIYTIYTLASNGCTTSSSIEIISLTSIPEITIAQDSLINCDQPTANINAISTNSNLSYLWTDSESTPLGISDSLIVDSGGEYQLHIVDENGCKNTYNVIIEEQLEASLINLVAGNINCILVDATVLIETEDNLTDIIWSDANGLLTSTPENQLIVDQAGWYYVQGSNEYGCESFDSILVLENIEVPLLNLLSPDTIIILASETTDILVDDLSTGTVTYQWLPSEGLSCDDCLEPTIIEFLHDSYELTATNEDGCTSTINVQVRLKKLTSVNIPNIFSPSSLDGNNDHFTLYGNENVVLINEMYVYDRWGNLVYNNNNFAPNDPYLGWDGLFKGEAVVNGVFIYLFRVTTNEGEILTFTGDVTKI